MISVLKNHSNFKKGNRKKKTPILSEKYTVTFYLSEVCEKISTDPSQDYRKVFLLEWDTSFSNIETG